MLTPLVSHRKLRERLAWMSAAALVAIMLVLLVSFQRRVPSSPTTVRFLVFPPENSYINAAADAALSPDGSQLAFVATDSTGKEVLWVRPFDSLTARPLAGTEGAAYPFWSLDGRWIGFFDITVFAGRSSLKKIDVSGGRPSQLRAQ